MKTALIHRKVFQRNPQGDDPFVVRVEFDGVLFRHHDVVRVGALVHPDDFVIPEHPRLGHVKPEGDVPMAVKGMTGGAFDFLEKPCSPQDFLAVVEKALKTRALVLENRALKRQLGSALILGDWVGCTPESQEVRNSIATAVLTWFILS